MAAIHPFFLIALKSLWEHGEALKNNYANSKKVPAEFYSAVTDHFKPPLIPPPC